jgi:CarD family transcriptional regulator
MEEHSEELDTIAPVQAAEFSVGDSVVYPHHGAGQVVRKEVKDVLGEPREYLTIKILHNDMTVMVPTANAARAGLRRVIDEDTVKKVLAVLQDECSEMPKNWNRRFKHNRDKIKTGDVYELAEVVRNLAIREAEKGLSTGEKQMFTRARKILASELMYALEMTADQVELHLDSLLLDSSGSESASLAGNGKLAVGNGKLPAGAKTGAGNGARAATPGAANGAAAASNGKVDVANGSSRSRESDLALSPE